MKTKLALLLLTIAFVLPIAANAAGVRRVYMCSNCHITIAAEQRPTSSGCSKATYHTWADLGRVGTNVFICQKCNKVVYTEMRPNSAYTKSHGYHSWCRIGEFGDKTYSCKKCGIVGRFKVAPSGVARGCSGNAGGYHHWYAL